MLFSSGSAVVLESVASTTKHREPSTLGKGVGKMEGPAFAGSFANGEVAPAECVWV
jgi:hypothetical protein